jgi:cation diffusion facilitator CzcD-associated flavoprotein CzcO
VTQAAWDAPSQRWEIDTTGGSFTARFLVLATGLLSEPSLPSIPGLGRFAGALFHSAAWDHEQDLRGARVAVIGTGASAIQFVPRIQPHVERLHVFQRTPPWILPHSDRRTTRVERALWRALPRSQHLWRAGVWAGRESLVVGLALQPRLMAAAELSARRHLRRQVADPRLREQLTPRYRLGCKRILISNDYYPALCQANVELITDGLSEARTSSILSVDGAEREIDAIILGTGFAATVPPVADYVRGRDGALLADAWRDGMCAYLGTMVAGFPNAFMLVGPNTGVGHSSMIYMIESQTHYVLSALRALQRRGAAVLDVRPEVQRAYNEDLQRRLDGTVWNSGGCRSWYLDASGRNTTLWPSFTFAFRDAGSARSARGSARRPHRRSSEADGADRARGRPRAQSQPVRTTSHRSRTRLRSARVRRESATARPRARARAVSPRRRSAVCTWRGRDGAARARRCTRWGRQRRAPRSRARTRSTPRSRA